MATHSSLLAWRIPGTGEPGGLPSMGLHRVGHDWSDLAAAADGTKIPWSQFPECWVLSPLFHSPLSLSSRDSSSSSLSAIRVMSSAYLRLLIFLLAILIPACASCSPAFLMMYSAYKLNKQGDHIQPWVTPFSYLEPICCSMSSSDCCLLTCIQISQEAGQVIWYSYLFQNFPEFLVVHAVKGFGIVNKAEEGVFLELFLFLWSKGCWQFDLWFLCLF